MKAMLLAAGRGARLKPLTDKTPKPLIEAAGKTLLDYHLDKLSNAGFSEVVINTSWLADQIQQHIQLSNYPKLNIILSHEPVALETAGGVHKALPHLGDGTFLLISADSWSEFDYAELRETKINDHDAHLFMVENPPHNLKGDYSLVNNKVTRATQATLTYSGIGVFHSRLFQDIAPTGSNTQIPLRNVLNDAIERNALAGSVMAGAWFDIGTASRLAALEQFIAEHQR